MGLHNLSFLQNPIQHGKGGRIFLHNYPPNQYKAFIKYFFEAVYESQRILTMVIYKNVLVMNVLAGVFMIMLSLICNTL